jgi:hypothetical protein
MKNATTLYSMWRTEWVFPAAAVVLLAVGLVARLSPPVTIWSAQSNSGYGYNLRPEAPIFGIAALCCILAALYSLGHIPFSEALARWHPWLTVVGLVMLGLGMGALLLLLGGRASGLGVAGALAIASVVGGIGVFVVAQTWFLAELFRAVAKMRHR